MFFSQAAQGFDGLRRRFCFDHACAFSSIHLIVSRRAVVQARAIFFPPDLPSCLRVNQCRQNIAARTKFLK
jgi:hypothetical protein